MATGLLTSETGYSLEEVKQRLHEEGPGYFLRQVRLQEDVSPIAPEPDVSDFIAERLARLAPKGELVVTDPYLFTYAVKDDPDPYARLVAGLLSPLLANGAKLVTIVDTHQTHAGVQAAVLAELMNSQPDFQVSVVKSVEFHDRFWIADRERGVVMGSSFNKIGRKIFFVDSLTTGDIDAVLKEVDRVLGD